MNSPPRGSDGPLPSPSPRGRRRSVAVRGVFPRPAAWQAAAVVVCYLAWFLAVGRVVALLAGDRVEGDLLASAGGILLGLALPIGVGALSLLLFARRRGVLRDLFARRRGGGRRWMWCGPILVLLAVAGHLGTVDPHAWSLSRVLALALAGLCVGVAEEFLTRGLVVRILRDAGRSERYTMLVSSLLFALLHTANLLSGVPVATVATTVVYTFGFGVCMYLTLRVTGSLWAAILLHALTDPTTMLATGGIDRAAGGAAGGAWTALTGLATAAMIVLALVAVPLLGRRRTGRTAPA
ncbi:CPBP family intramembrane glutamic endopeptidase (plasmid) [Streptomyces sp. BI20]|uniref:CPBP family intramembrane glutamic endopeptidase n=1 Tax=Streptomyces sp. BI20 TaxID=3403460 RepID=UPI003C780497